VTEYKNLVTFNRP